MRTQVLKGHAPRRWSIRRIGSEWDWMLDTVEMTVTYLTMSSLSGRRLDSLL